MTHFTSFISKYIRIATALLVLLTGSQYLAAKDFVVVIDPGHGGHDPGAIGRNKTKEKNINLGVALKYGTKNKGQLQRR